MLKLPSVLFLLTLSSWLAFASAAQALYARIHSVSGRVELKRNGWSSYQRALPGRALFGDDLLRPALGSRVIVTCPDGQRARRTPTPGGETSVISLCPTTPRSDVRPGFGVSNVWGGNDPTVPFVITPRSDFVLSGTPTLRWQPVLGAEVYTVTMTSLTGELWQVTTNHTTLPYPEGVPALRADGSLYALVVSTDTGRASRDEAIDLRFQRLLGPDVAVAEAEIAEVQAMDLPEEIKTLVLVEEVYPKYSLTAVAINDLKGLIEKGEETAHIYRLLGDLYVKSGVQIPAEESYHQALELAAAEENLEDATLAHLGLGTLYQAIGQPENAIALLQQALSGAKELGDRQLIDSIERQLGRL